MESTLEGRAIAVETVGFKGHPLVSALHPTTIEVTMEEHLTPRGDCIIGVGAEKGCSGLSERTRAGIRAQGSVVVMTIRVGSRSFVVSGRGGPGLSLSHPHDIVIRRSFFLSDRTLAVGADAAAVDMPREMAALLRRPGAEGTLEIEVRGR